MRGMSREEVGGVKGKESVIRVYNMRKLFSMQGEILKKCK